MKSNNNKITLHVKNYRTLRDCKFDIFLNEVNYFLGANESGKTNLLNSLIFIDPKRTEKISFRASQDKTKKVDKSEKFEIKIFENAKINHINELMNQIFLAREDKNSGTKHNNLFSSVDTQSVKQELEEWNRNHKDDQFNVKSVTEGIHKRVQPGNKFLKDWETLDSKYPGSLKTVLPTLDSLCRNVRIFYDSLKIKLPLVYYNEPWIIGEKEASFQYPIADIQKKNSVLRNIFNAFCSTEDKEKVLEYFDNPNQENSNLTIADIDRIIDDDLNKKIENYFKPIQGIKAWPKLKRDGSNLNMLVTRNPDMEHDNPQENERSFGWKILSRILLELKAISSMENERIIYIIDEPETSLHPFLQFSLMRKVLEMKKNNKNLTIVIATHSPFVLHPPINELSELGYVNLVSKEKTGESSVMSFANGKMISRIKNYYKNSKKGKLSEEDFLIKIVYFQYVNNVVDNFIKSQMQKVEDDIPEEERRKNELFKIFRIKDFLKIKRTSKTGQH